ncbi:hypothetical protein [Streptomyces aureocirculatus]|uniref:hypothetical protein n=1 Tax=Streptomyces aureocirculatus TaxID=67275 RepID=UPI0004C73314|nr:hypothetical protein [Streptomyces aureocirculatus]
MNDLHHAVVVGINRYPAITDLRGARGDADHALYRTNTAARAAVEGDAAAWPGTRLYVSLAGHGTAPFGGDAALLVGRGVRTTWPEAERRSAPAVRGGPGTRGVGEHTSGSPPPAADAASRVQAYVREIAGLTGEPVGEIPRNVSRDELCRRTGLPHRPVERAVEQLRKAEPEPGRARGPGPE